jgi:tripartite-type tricarboxylate transporter receptor subunit TctC
MAGTAGRRRGQGRGQGLGRRGLLVLPFLGARAGSAAEGDFPNRPVTIIVPFPPGGATDAIARPVAAGLQKVWGQSVVLQNRGGGGGAIGMNAAQRLPADGYSALIQHVAWSSIPAADALFGRPPSIDTAAFTPISLLTADPLIFCVKADAPWRNWAEFVADARARPGEIAYGSSGAYSAVHLPAEMLAHAAGIRLHHVPYTGGGPLMTALLGGQIATTSSVPTVMAPFIKDGQMRALVSTGAKRVALLPDVPTAMELGYSGVEFYLWVGLFTQAGVDPALIARWRDGIAAAVAAPETLRALAGSGSVLDLRTGADFAAFLAADARRVTDAVQRIGRVE